MWQNLNSSFTGFSTVEDLASRLPRQLCCWDHHLMIIMQGVPRKVQTECFCSHIAQAQSPVAGMPFVWKLCFGFGCFLLRQSRIKHSQVISMGKFRPSALKFGKGSYFILEHSVEGEKIIIFTIQSWRSWWSWEPWWWCWKCCDATSWSTLPHCDGILGSEAIWSTKAFHTFLPTVGLLLFLTFIRLANNWK